MSFRSTRTVDNQRMRRMASNASLYLAPTGDDFSVNTIANYTFNGTWAISGGYMNCTSGFAGSVLFHNTATWADGTVGCVVREAGNAGLLGRFQDSSHYYVAVARDASSASGSPNTLSLYVNNGGYTALGSTVAIAFTRDTLHTLEMTFSGTSIVVKFDGVTMISVTDSTFSSGGIGLWSDTLPNQWDSLSW